eukprot:TRINITY_DN10687_c0_g1_i1.p1 TRINITY_DN10687_c0_g1~~TRINITY_DN10687_c0_g1_i1.p1  ORF type:complete len:1615 (+),score=228.92 TRINITY_DN10687_c0_g1_i1:91-4845(+)
MPQQSPHKLRARPSLVAVSGAEGEPQECGETDGVDSPGDAGPSSALITSGDDFVPLTTELSDYIKHTPAFTSATAASPPVIAVEPPGASSVIVGSDIADRGGSARLPSHQGDACTVASDTQTSSVDHVVATWDCPVCLTDGNYSRFCRSCELPRPDPNAVEDDASDFPRCVTQLLQSDPDPRTPRTPRPARFPRVALQQGSSPQRSRRSSPRRVDKERQLELEQRRMQLIARSEAQIAAARQRVRTATYLRREQRAALWAEILFFTTTAHLMGRAQVVQHSLAVLRALCAPQLRRWAHEARERILRRHMEPLMRRPTEVDLLRSEAFQGTGGYGLQDIAHEMMPVVFLAGTKIYTEGDRWGDIYYLDIGNVDITSARGGSGRLSRCTVSPPSFRQKSTILTPPSPLARKSATRRLQPGNVFGDFSPVRPPVRQALAVCVNNCALWKLPQREAQALAGRLGPRAGLASANYTASGPPLESSQSPAVSPAAGAPPQQPSPRPEEFELSSGLHSGSISADLSGQLSARDLLASCPVLSSVTESALQTILARTTASVCHRGDVLQAAGQRADRVCILARGAARGLPVPSLSLVPDKLHPGAVFGVESLGSLRTYCATIIARCFCDIWVIRKADIIDAVMTLPTVQPPEPGEAPPPPQPHMPSALLEVRRRADQWLEQYVTPLAAAQLQQAGDLAVPGVPTRVWRAFTSIARPRVHTFGDSIVRHGTPAAAAIFIAEGAARLVGPGNLTCGTVQAGTILGLAETVVGAPWSYTVCALQQLTVIWLIPADGMVEAMRREQSASQQTGSRELKEKKVRRAAAHMVQALLTAAQKAFELRHGEGAAARQPGALRLLAALPESGTPTEHPAPAPGRLSIIATEQPTGAQGGIGAAAAAPGARRRVRCDSVDASAAADSSPTDPRHSIGGSPPRSAFAMTQTSVAAFLVCALAGAVAAATGSLQQMLVHFATQPAGHEEVTYMRSASDPLDAEEIQRRAMARMRCVLAVRRPSQQRILQEDADADAAEPVVYPEMVQHYRSIGCSGQVAELLHAVIQDGDPPSRCPSEQCSAPGSPATPPPQDEPLQRTVWNQAAATLQGLLPDDCFAPPAPQQPASEGAGDWKQLGNDDISLAASGSGGELPVLPHRGELATPEPADPLLQIDGGSSWGALPPLLPAPGQPAPAQAPRELLVPLPDGLAPTSCLAAVLGALQRPPPRPLPRPPRCAPGGSGNYGKSAGQGTVARRKRALRLRARADALRCWRKLCPSTPRRSSCGESDVPRLLPAEPPPPLPYAAAQLQVQHSAGSGLAAEPLPQLPCRAAAPPLAPPPPRAHRPVAAEGDQVSLAPPLRQRRQQGRAPPCTPLELDEAPDITTSWVAAAAAAAAAVCAGRLPRRPFNTALSGVPPWVCVPPTQPQRRGVTAGHGVPLQRHTPSAAATSFAATLPAAPTAALPTAASDKRDAYSPPRQARVYPTPPAYTRRRYHKRRKDQLQGSDSFWLGPQKEPKGVAPRSTGKAAPGPPSPRRLDQMVLQTPQAAPQQGAAAIPPIQAKRLGHASVQPLPFMLRAAAQPSALPAALAPEAGEAAQRRRRVL